MYQNKETRIDSHRSGSKIILDLKYGAQRGQKIDYLGHVIITWTEKTHFCPRSVLFMNF